MADYTKRLQILLSEEQYAFIKETAKSRRISVGELIRNAVEEIYRPRISLRELQALSSLASRELFAWDCSAFLEK